MTALNKILLPLRRAAAALFKSDVALRKERDGVHIVLQERAVKKSRKATHDEHVERKLKEELAQVRADLAALLNELPETRTTMRHLVFVEQAIGKKGLRALHKLPLDVLQRALEQLENLVTNWSPVGLANLRSKMAVAIIDREHMDPKAEADAYRTAAVLDAPREGPAPEPVPQRSDDEALAAAYAALGNLAPTTVQMQGELGSASARALEKPANTRPGQLPELQLRELQA